MVKFGVFGACFCRFPYVFAVFFSWIMAFCASVDERYVVQGVLSVWRRAPDHVDCVWCLGVLFCFHFGSKHPDDNFCDALCVLEGIIFWVELLPLSALKATTTQKIFAFFTFFGQEIASLLQVVAPLFEQGVSHEAVERCRERCLASNRPGIEGPAKPIHIGG